MTDWFQALGRIGQAKGGKEEARWLVTMVGGEKKKKIFCLVIHGNATIQAILLAVSRIRN